MTLPSMAFSPVNGLRDTTYSPTIASSETAIRTQVQGVSDQLMNYINDTLIPALQSIAAGNSGADNIGMVPIAAIGIEATVQSVVAAFVTRLQAVTAGSGGASFIGVETIAGLTGNDIQTILVALKTYADAFRSLLATSAGAGLVGVTPPSGLSGSTVQAILNALKAAIDSVVASGIAAGSVTNTMLATDVRVGSLTTLLTTDKSSVTNAVNEHFSNMLTPHGAVSAATASKIPIRDTNGGFSNTYLQLTGLTGATGASRYVGVVSGAAPTSGTFLQGDWVVDPSGAMWVCAVGGTPGIWSPITNTTSSGMWTPSAGFFSGKAIGAVINIASIASLAKMFSVCGTNSMSGAMGSSSNSGTAWQGANGQVNYITPLSSTSMTHATSVQLWDGTYTVSGYFQLNTGYLQFVVTTASSSSATVATTLYWGVS